jgi:N6-adenosine-specific RNA methylase IME4
MENIIGAGQEAARPAPGKYKIVYADPPWQFSAWNEATAQRHVSKQYQTMAIDQMASIPVRNICCENSVLFMWATFPNLKLAIRLIDAWGFTYKTTAFVWIKKNKCGSNFLGMGYYTRSNAEICLLATRGKPLPRMCHNISSVVESPVMEHSKKPDIIRGHIVSLFGDLPRIELFARQNVLGWDAWGNEVTNCAPVLGAGPAQNVKETAPTERI